MGFITGGINTVNTVPADLTSLHGVSNFRRVHRSVTEFRRDGCVAWLSKDNVVDHSRDDTKVRGSGCPGCDDPEVEHWGFRRGYAYIPGNVTWQFASILGLE